jgi:hypothetical protein
MYPNSISSFFSIPIQIHIRRNRGISDTICIREEKSIPFIFITNYIL